MANAPRLSVVRDQTRPRKLGRYELEECLGAVGGIETYRARVRGLAGFDRIFAVKCLRRPRGNPVTINDPYVKTAKRTAMVNDARIARVLDADVIDGVAIAVTEFVHGLDLERFRECAQVSGVLSTGTDDNADKWQKIVAYVGSEAAGGLATIHALAPPLLHGGLSPRNIIATARGGIKVLDIGLGQAAGRGGEPNTLAYVVPESDGSDAGDKRDMRALGVILFELATGERPPVDRMSEAARTILDSLWPSMAGFIASLLSDDAAARPSAAEAAQTLAAHWADVPDASMVTEMATLVRNFSAFVADTTLSHTSPPIPNEPAKPVPTPIAPAKPVSIPSPPASVFSIPPPVPPPARAEEALPALDADPVPEIAPDLDIVVAPDVVPDSIELAPTGMVFPEVDAAAPSHEPTDPASSGSFFAIHDAPTRVRETGSYASALFQAVPTDADMPPTFEASESDGMVSPPIAAPEGSSPSTLKSFPTADLMPSGAMPAYESDLAITTPISDPLAPMVPVPEVADWGARALAALGDQAGVPVTPVPLTVPTGAPARRTIAPPPPLVSNPAIEEAFTYAPPAPAPGPGADEAAIDIAMAPVDSPVRPPTSGLLEDELVDEQQDAVVMADSDVEETSPALVAPTAFAIDELGTQSTSAPPRTEAPLEATAFEEGESETAAHEWTAPRLAHAMTTTESGSAKRTSTSATLRVSAVRSAALEGVRQSRLSAGMTRALLVVGVFLGVGGAVAGALVGLDFFAKQPTKMDVSKRNAAKASPPQPLTAKASPPKPVTTKPAAAPSPEPVGRQPSVPKRTVAAVPVKPVAPASAVDKGSQVTDKTKGGTVSVAIATTPDGAMVWVDGEERGKSPCQLKLRPGRSHVVLVRAGYETDQLDLDVRDGAKVEATLKPAVAPMTGDARFRADCQTTGKLPIVVDGKETGILCPFSKMRVDPGRHTIGLLIPATGKIHQKEVTLSAGVRSIAFGD
jgi:hypothetical protein